MCAEVRENRNENKNHKGRGGKTNLSSTQSDVETIKSGWYDLLFFCKVQMM